GRARARARAPSRARRRRARESTTGPRRERASRGSWRGLLLARGREHLRLGGAPLEQRVRPGGGGVEERALRLEQVEEVAAALAVRERGEVRCFAERGEHVGFELLVALPRRASPVPPAVDRGRGLAARLLQLRGCAVSLRLRHRETGAGLEGERQDDADALVH